MKSSRSFGVVGTAVLSAAVLGLMVATGGCGNKEAAVPDASYNPDAGKGANGVPKATGAHAATAPKPPKAD